MTALVTMTFRKMNGLGNEFVILDGRRDPVVLSPAQVQAIADRQTGIGCDQLIVMEPAKGADVRMRIWNSDGAEVESCGNASRCVADLLFEETGRDTVTIETRGGLLICTRASEGRVTVDMGAPRFGWEDIPLSEPFHDTRAVELQVGPIDKPLLHSPSVVNVGNPHCIFWVDDVDAHDLGRFGPMLEFHPLFPERANISLCEVRDRGHLVLKVWERGAGLTRACGTAACAAAVSAARKGLADRAVRVTLPGGDLDIVWRESDDHILMTGPVAYEFTGDVPEGLMAGAP
jgi:diaminopimelate epimerase